MREYIADESIEVIYRAEVKMLPHYGTFKQAQKVRETGPEQAELELWQDLPCKSCY